MEKHRRNSTLLKGHSTGTRAISNLSALILSSVVANAVTFITVAYLARSLTAEGLGRLSFAQALYQYFLLIGNFGLNLFGIREIARDRARIRSTVNTVVTLQTLLSMVAAGLIVLFAFLLSKPYEDKILISLFALDIVVWGVFLDWVFRGLETMRIVAAAQALRAIVYAGLVFALVRNQGDILRIPIFHFFSTLVLVAIPGIVYITRYGWPRPSFDSESWRHALKTALPFLFISVLIQIYYNLDTVMLGFLKSNETVGLYSAAYKIIFLIISIGALIQDVFFPVFSRFFVESKEKLGTALNIAQHLFVTISIPLGVGGTILARPLIAFIYGGTYSGAVLPFKLLIWTVVIQFFGITFGTSLLTTNKERHFMYSVGCGALANVILNFLLIPRFGAEGAAIATIVAQTIVTTLLIIFSRSVARITLVSNLPKPLIASAVMGLALVWSPFPIILNLFMGALIYLIIFSLLKGFHTEEIALLKNYLPWRKAS